MPGAEEAAEKGANKDNYSWVHEQCHLLSKLSPVLLLVRPSSLSTCLAWLGLSSYPCKICIAPYMMFLSIVPFVKTLWLERLPSLKRTVSWSNGGFSSRGAARKTWGLCKFKNRYLTRTAVTQTITSISRWSNSISNTCFYPFTWHTGVPACCVPFELQQEGKPTREKMYIAYNMENCEGNPEGKNSGEALVILLTIGDLWTL